MTATHRGADLTIPVILHPPEVITATTLLHPGAGAAAVIPLKATPEAVLAQVPVAADPEEAVDNF